MENLLIHYGVDALLNNIITADCGVDSVVINPKLLYAGADALLNLQDEKLAEKEVISCCTPLNPFYVRWINTLGGFDHYMFCQNQIYEQNVKTQTTVNPVVDDIMNANYIEKEIEKEVTRTVSVGSGNLTPIEYNELLKISTSPRVEYWDKEIKKWIRIYVASGKFEENTWETRKEIEIEFTLPPLQIQF